MTALQCTDCIVSSSPSSPHSSAPLPIKTSFFLLHKQLSFGGILSVRASSAGKVILPLVFSVKEYVIQEQQITLGFAAALLSKKHNQHTDLEESCQQYVNITGCLKPHSMWQCLLCYPRIKMLLSFDIVWILQEFFYSLCISLLQQP